MLSIKTGIAGFLLIATSLPIRAQTVTPNQMFGTTPYESPSCNTPDYHELDFMHGRWALKILKDGKWVPGGYADYKPALGGCISFEYVSFENWGDFYKTLSGRNGFAGFAINTFDKTTSLKINYRQ